MKTNFCCEKEKGRQTTNIGFEDTQKEWCDKLGRKRFKMKGIPIVENDGEKSKENKQKDRQKVTRTTRIGFEDTQKEYCDKLRRKKGHF